MKIPATLQPLIEATRRDMPTLLKQLQVGRTVQATVLAELKPGLLRLQIATTELLARTQLMLPAGTALKLEVVRGYPVPELRILRTPTPVEYQQQAVRSAMARQLPPQDIRQGLVELRSQAQTTQQTNAVRQFTAVLQQAGVKLDQLNPAQLQRAVALSGIFHEARLLAGSALQPMDIKTQLLQLLAQLGGDGRSAHKPAPPPGPDESPQARDNAGDALLNRLVRLIEGSVARIQLQQSTALPVDDNQRQVWQLDLPIQHHDETDDLMLRIEHEDGGGEAGGNAHWAVNLAFQFDTIGTLQCRIALSGERVATTFWCAQPATRERVEQRLPRLQDALEAQGLEVVHLAGLLGEPAEPLIRIVMPDSLLDERA